MPSDQEREAAVERAIRHYPRPLVDARELTEAVLDETDAFDDLADPRREVLDWLKVLRRTGDVVSHSPGSNAITWAHRDRVIERAPPRDPADHPDQADLERASEPAPEATPEHDREGARERLLKSARASAAASGGARPPAHNAEASVHGRPDDVHDALADVAFPEGRDRAECADAIAAARTYIREHDGATMRELVRDVLPEHPLGYQVVELEEGDRYRGAWWRRIIKPGLENLPDVEKPPRGGSTWTVKEN